MYYCEMLKMRQGRRAELEEAGCVCRQGLSQTLNQTHHFIQSNPSVRDCKCSRCVAKCVQAIAFALPIFISLLCLSRAQKNYLILSVHVRLTLITWGVRNGHIYYRPWLKTLVLLFLTPITCFLLSETLCINKSPFSALIQEVMHFGFMLQRTCSSSPSLCPFPLL